MAGVSTDDAARADGDLVGRAAELAAINTFIDSLGRGPAMLVLQGEAGLGKTTLWREGLHAAERRSFRVLECRPVQAEAQLAFTALSDLLTNVPDTVFEKLPGPQRRALEVALLRAEPEDDERFPRAVAVGFLGVLATLARSGPFTTRVTRLLSVDSWQADGTTTTANGTRPVSLRLRDNGVFHQRGRQPCLWLTIHAIVDVPELGVTVGRRRASRLKFDAELNLNPR